MDSDTQASPATALRQIELRAGYDDTAEKLLLALTDQVHGSCEVLEPDDPADACDWLLDLQDALVAHLLDVFPGRPI